MHSLKQENSRLRGDLLKKDHEIFSLNKDIVDLNAKMKPFLIRKVYLFVFLCNYDLILLGGERCSSCNNEFIKKLSRKHENLNFSSSYAAHVFPVKKFRFSST